MATIKLYCKTKTEDVRGIAVNFTANDDATMAAITAASAPQPDDIQGYLNITNVPKDYAERFTPGKRYELSLKEIGGTDKA